VSLRAYELFQAYELFKLTSLARFHWLKMISRVYVLLTLARFHCLGRIWGFSYHLAVPAMLVPIYGGKKRMTLAGLMNSTQYDAAEMKLLDDLTLIIDKDNDVCARAPCNDSEGSYSGDEDRDDIDGSDVFMSDAHTQAEKEWKGFVKIKKGKYFTQVRNGSSTSRRC
jgi:hypothetical protein